MEKISQELISNQSNIQKQVNDFQERITVSFVLEIYVLLQSYISHLSALQSTAIQLANTENRFNHFANYKFTENVRNFSTFLWAFQIFWWYHCHWNNLQVVSVLCAIDDALELEKFQVPFKI